MTNSIKEQFQNEKSQFEQVKEFHLAFNCPAPEAPTALTEKLVVNRANFILEEVIELLHASSDGDNEKFGVLFNSLIEAAHKTYEKQLTKPYPENKLIGQVDAFTDILYFANGGFTEMGVIPDKIFDLVHQANMGKIFPDGKPHYNEVGKVIKPDNWEHDHAPEPKIEAEIKHQIELSRK